MSAPTDSSDTSDESDTDEPVLTQVVFRYNPVHDLESLWWISAYLLVSQVFMLKGDGTDGTGEEDPRLARQRTVLQKLFTIGDERRWTMCTENGFYREVKTLHPLMRKAGRALDNARDVLARAYHYLEQDIEHRAFDVRPETYEEMRKMYTRVAKRMEAEDVHVEHLKIW